MRRFVLLALLVSTLVGAPFGLWWWHLNDGTTVRGIRVAGQRLAPTKEPSNALRERADQWLDTSLGVRAGPVLVVRTRRQLGASIDVDAVSASALAVARSRSPVDDFGAWRHARAGGVDLPWPVLVSRAAIESMLDELRIRVDREPMAARHGTDGRVLEPGQPGYTLDVAGSIASLERAIREEELLCELVVTEDLAPVPPPPPRELVVVGTWSTRVSGGASRVHNVALATERLDGAVIPAGGRLSFNERVGNRSLGDGYRVAPVIVGGEMVDGVGGGTCQVASTLHAAGFVGGMDAPTQVPHSRPAGYVPLGLDATVVWPHVDLVLQNPYRFPLLVRAGVNRRRLQIDLLGHGPASDVTWSRSVQEDAEPGERVIEDPATPIGEALVTQDGIPGYVVIRRRELSRNGRVVREERVLRYPPTDRIVRIAPIPPK